MAAWVEARPAAPLTIPDPESSARSSPPLLSSARAAKRAPRRFAIAASATGSLPPATAPTANSSRCSVTTSAVERPIEPVAPRMLIVRCAMPGVSLPEIKGGKDQPDHRVRRPEPVEPIHHPTMTGDQLARILDAEAALHCGFA